MTCCWRRWAGRSTGWTGQPGVLVALEGHGREDIGGSLDLSRTVGWFTTEFPVALHLPAAPAPRIGARR